MLIILAPLPENTIHLFPIFELNTQMSFLNNEAFPTILSTIFNR